MYIVLSIISLFAGIIGALGIYMIYRNGILKKRNGRIITGKKMNCEELLGMPIRYMAEVEYKVNNETKLRKIVTTDKKIRKYANNEQIPLVYVDRIDKIFWAEENSHEKTVYILLLAFFSAFMFSLSFTFLMILSGIF